MALNVKQVSVMAYANGFTIWSYKTKDCRLDIIDKGYFDFCNKIFENGDLIDVIIYDKDENFKDFIQVVVVNVDRDKKTVEVKLLKGLEC